MATPPAVSVVIPTYNRALLLPRAIESVREQTMTDWELILVDDGSTDGTLDVTASYAAADPRIRSCPNRGRNGPAAARNAGLGECRAPWVAFLDSDDRWMPEKLKLFLEAAGAFPEAVLIGSNYWIVDRGAGTRQTMLDFIDRTMMPWWEHDLLLTDAVPWAAIKASPAALAGREAMISGAISGFLWVHTSSAMVRLDAVRRAGGFDECLQEIEDVDLWLRLAETGPVVFIPEELAVYDRTGRDLAEGERYAGHDPARMHTPYSSRLCHLRYLLRIGHRHRLTAAQRMLLAERTVAGHLSCAGAARRATDFPTALLHRLAAYARALVPYGAMLAKRLKRRIVRATEAQKSFMGRR